MTIKYIYHDWPAVPMADLLKEFERVEAEIGDVEAQYHKAADIENKEKIEYIRVLRTMLAMKGSQVISYD